MWRILFFTLAVAAVSAMAQEDQYENTNCRGQSLDHLVEGKPATMWHVERDRNRDYQDTSKLEECEASLGADLVKELLDSSGLIAEDDHGFIEYHPPGQKEFTRCQYEINKGTPVPQDLLRFLNVIPRNPTETWPWKRVFDLVKPIVLFGCQLIS